MHGYHEGFEPAISTKLVHLDEMLFCINTMITKHIRYWLLFYVNKHVPETDLIISRDKLQHEHSSSSPFLKWYLL